MPFAGSTLVIETASEACSVALFDGDKLVSHDHQLLGRGHAESLIPMIEALPDRGKAEQIVVSLGPGSFTGVRIGIAAARALGVAWGAKVLGYPTLALIAAMARSQSGEGTRRVTVCVSGGHGQWFVQNFASSGQPEGSASSLTPEAAAQRVAHEVIAGNRAQALTDIIGKSGATALAILPDASQASLLPEACLTGELAPLYGRGPDAVPQAHQVPTV